MTPLLSALLAPDPGRDPAEARLRAAALSAALGKLNHDLRNALSTATLAADRLAKNDDPLVARLVPKLLESIEQALEIASATLDFAGDDPALVARVPVAAADLVTLAAADAAEVTPALVWDNQVPAGTVVSGDAGMLRAVLGELAANAAAAGATRLTVGFAVEGVRHVVRVADNGHGLSERARTYLFVPVLGATPGHSGLGLTLARGVARAMGGDLRLHASGGDGATFVLELPA